MRKIFIGFVLFLSSGWTYSNSDPMIWSGLGFLVDANKTQEVYPYSDLINQRFGVTKKLRDALSNDENFIIGSSGNVTASEGYNNVILAITDETVSSTKRGKGICSRYYYLSTQVILYSAIDKTILKVVPLTKVRPYADETINGKCSNSSISRNIHLKRFAEMLWGIELKEVAASELTNEFFLKNFVNADITESGILGEQINNLQTLKNIFATGSDFIGVRHVKVTDYSINQMTGDGDFAEHTRFSKNKRFDSKKYKEWVGSEFSRWLSTQLNIPIIPFYEGQGLTLNVATTFSDSQTILNLQKPELSYGFDFTVRGFNKVLLGETSKREAFAWGGFSRVYFGVVLGDQIDDIKVLADVSLTQGNVKEINKTDVVNDWNYFDDAIQLTFSNYSRNLMKPEKKWVTEATELNVRDFKKVAKVILEKVNE